MPILDQYVRSAPSSQNALDIFAGEWASRLPGEFGALRAGDSPLFEDSRVTWCVEQMGGTLAGRTVLELGPLEGGHTYMLDRAGAASIVAVEANTRAYLKCLVAKEMVGIPSARFLCGDFVQYLRSGDSPNIDLCFASGVLYHMENPAELLALIAAKADRLLLWTHYFDDRLVGGNRRIAHRFSAGEPAEHGGFLHTLHRQEYGQSPIAYLRGWRGFCGGSAPTSRWMDRNTILECLRHIGLSEIVVGDENARHPNGPCFTVYASKPQAKSPAW